MRRVRSIGFISLIAVMLLTLPGCWVMSVYPLYETDERLPADPGLVGQWWQPDGDCRLSISVAQAYTGRQELAVEYSAPEERAAAGCVTDSGTRPVQLQGRLVDVEGHLFLDLLPSEPDTSFQTMPVHSLYRITVRNDELDLVPLSPDFLCKAIRAGKVQGMIDDDVPVLTAPTPELRKFLLALADDSQAFAVVDGDRNWHFTRMPAGIRPRTPPAKPKPECAEAPPPPPEPPS